MADQCPIIVGDGVYGQVTTVMANMWGNAETAFGVAIEAMQELGSFQLNPINTNTAFNVDSAWWHVLRPHAPTRPSLVWNPDFDLLPPPPTGDIGGPIAFTAPPTFTETAPVIPTRTGPGPLTALPPVGPPDLDLVVVPNTPTFVIPDFPGLRDIVLPDPPTIVLPTFQGVRPNINVAVPVNTFAFQTEPYSSALVDKVKLHIGTMLDGAPGLPTSAIQQMKDRASSSVDIEQARAEQETIEAFGARGFSEPNGVLSRKLREVRQNGQNERNRLARDVYIEDVKQAVDDFRFAIAQGVALETVLMSNYLGVQQLILEGAKAAIQIAIEVANAEIAVANLELEVFKTDAQVFRDLLQAELAKLEIYKAELDGKRLIGELNAQDIAVYSERVKTVFALIEVYKAEIEGAKAKAEVNVARIQAYSETVKAYDTRVHAYDTEWSAFSRQLDSDLSQYKRYELATQVFGNRIDIWSKTNTNFIDQKRLAISERELDITAYRAQLDKIATILNVTTQRLDAGVRVYSSDIDKYRADAAIEQVVSEGNARPFQLALEQEKSRVAAVQENVRLALTQAQETAKLIVGKLGTIAQTSSQLAAGFASAMSVHAGISSSLSQGQSCNTSFNYSIDTNA